MKIQHIRRVQFVRRLFSRTGGVGLFGGGDTAPAESWQPLEGRLLMSVSTAPTPLSAHAGAGLHAIALIDSTLPDQSLLSQSLPATVQRIVYNPATQTAQQVLTLAADAAKFGGAKLDSLLIFSHGIDGEFALGNGIISPHSLQQTASQWRSLAALFSDHASIDLYGCDTAAGPAGQRLLNELHHLSGATVFGSTNITGHGGDWILEGRSQNASSRKAIVSPLDAAVLTSYPADLLLSVGTAPTANPNPATGTTTALSVIFLDIGGSPTITWSTSSAPTGGTVAFSNNNTTTASNTTATFTKAGSYTIAVSAHDSVLNVTIGSSVTVTVNQTLTTIAVNPSATTLATSGTQQFAAVGYDQFGNAMATQPTFAWSKTAGTGTLSAAGLYTAPASAGSATIAATSGGVTGTASVTTAATGPTVATPAAASPSAVTGTSTALTVLGADSSGESTLTYAWAATTKPAGGVVTFSANATNAAKNSTASFNEPGTYVLTATISDGTHVVTSPVTVTVSSAVNTVNVSPGTASLPQNATQSFTAVAYDQFGNPLATQPTFTWTTGNGSVGTVNSSGVYTAPAGTGAATVLASSGGVSGTSAVTVYNAAPTVATPAAATTVSLADTSVLTVLGADDGGESNLTYHWAATSAPAGGTTAFSLNNSNLAKTTTATFNKAGNYTLAATITDAGGLSTTSAVNVTVGAVATTLQVLPGTTANLNENGSEALTTTVLDQFGNALGVQPNVTYAVTTGSGTVTSGGVFTAPAGPGTNVVQVSSGGLTQNVTINVTNAAPTVVTPATANPNPVAGTTTNLTTLGADDGGEANLTYTWSATTVPGGAAAPTFGVNGTNAAKHSTASFSAAGTYTFQVAISDGTNTTDSSVIVVVAQTLTTLTVTPPTAALHENGTQQFTAAGTDQFGAAMIVPPVVGWSKASGVGTISVTGLYTAPAGVGTATVSATSGTVVGNASVAVTNAAPVIVTPAAATPSPVTGTTTALSVAATDDGGAANLTYTWSALSKPAGSSPAFSVNGTNAAAASTVTFNAAGSYTFQVAVSDGTNVTTSSVNVTVVQTASSIGVTAPTGMLPENGHETLSAVADDQFGAPLSIQPTFTWNVVGVGASIDGTGDLTGGPLPGPDVVTAAASGVVGTDTVTVYNASPTVATPAAAGSTVVTGTGTTLSVLGADDGGEANLTYSWAATVKPAGSSPTFGVNGTNAAKNDTVTFNAPGAYTLTATITDAGGLSTTSSTAVTVVQTLSSVTVTPLTTSLNLNGTQQFNAAGTDQFGNAMVIPPTFTWSDAGVGSVSATGLYTSGTTAGGATITAGSGGVSGTATVTVTNAAPTIAVPAAATPVTNTTSTLAVLGSDDGGEAGLTYTWVATTKPAGSAVTFSANGTNAAKATTATFNRAGTYVLTANVSDGTNSTPSSVTVSVGQNVTTISVTPSHAGVNLDGTQQFAAAAFDQFNQSMATAPTFTWAVTGTAGGSVSSAGLYTASTTAGSATISATAAGKTGSATVTVTNAAPTVATAAAASPSPVTGTTTALSVLGTDDGGEAGLTYTWAATTEPTGASPSFSANGTNGAKATTVTFNQAGNYTFTATITDGGGLTATSAVSVTVQPTLTSVTVSPAASVTPINGTQQFAAVADDQFGDALATQPAFTWGSTVGSVDGTGLYTAPATVGLATITASTGGISGTATDLAVGSPTIQSSVDPSGTNVHLEVVGIGDPSVAVTWAVDSSPVGAPAPTFTVIGTAAAQHTVMDLGAAGTYVVQAAENGNTIFKTVTVSQQLSSLSVSPATATLSENGTQQFTASGYDQFGNAMIAPGVASWAVTSGSGSISAGGLYTAPAAPGNAWVTASESDGSGNTITGTAGVTIDNAPPTIATAPSATPNPTATTTTHLSVLGADDGGESNLTYTWATTGTPPGAVSFSANGTNAAKATTVTFTKAGTYSFDVAVSDGTNTTTSSTVTVVVTPVLGAVTVSPGSSNLSENGTQQFAATASDQFGNAMTGQTFTWSLGNGGVGSVSNAGLYTAPDGTGTATVIASDGLASGSASVTISNAAPVLTAAATASPSPATGTTAALSVAATDDGTAPGGGTDLTYTWTAVSEPTGATPTFSSNGTDAANNTTVTFNEPGNYTFQASVSDGTHTITSNVNESVVAALASLAISPAAPSLSLNQQQTFTATGLDQFGSALATAPAVTWSATGDGTIDPSTGILTTGSTPGTVSLTGTSGSVTKTITATIVNAAPTVAQAAAANPADVTGTTTNLTVLGADDGGEANLTYTWAATTVPSGATVSYATNASNGARSTTATFDEAGNYAFTVTISDGTNQITSSVPVTVEQTGSGFTITPANPTIDENSTQHFATAQVDQFGNAMGTPAVVAWAVTGGTGTIDSNGTFTAPGTAESDTITATVAGVTHTLAFNITNAPPTIIAVASANPANVTGTTSSLSVSAVDDGGESNLTYTWAPTMEPAGAAPTFGDNGDDSAADTIVTFNEAGNYTFRVDVSDGTNTASSSVNVTVQQTLSTIVVSPSSADIDANSSQQFTATGLDRFGDPVVPQPAIDWSNTGVGTVDSGGNYTAPDGGGVATVIASASGVSATAAVTVDYSAPTIATAASATPDPVTGTTTALSVLGADAAGESHLSYTWTAATAPAGGTPVFSDNGDNTAKNATVTFNKAGDYLFTVAVTDGTQTVTSSVNVEVEQTLSGLTINPPSAVIRPGATEQFTGVAEDQFNNPMQQQPAVDYAVTTGGGTVSGTGLYTAPAAQGAATVTATAAGLTASAPVQVSNSIASISAAATASPNPVTGTHTQLNVLGADTAGEQYLTYTWAMTAGPAGATPTFSVNGTNAAKHTVARFNEAGNYTFTVTLSDGTNTVTSSVNVTVFPTAAGVTVFPAAAVLHDGDTQLFLAVQHDQFGNAMPTQPAFTWSLSSGNGSINAVSGVYTAGGADGYTTVQASGGGMAGNANITVLGPSPTITQTAAASPSPVTGTTTNLSVLGDDAGGESTLNYTWAMTAGPAGAAPLFSVNGTNASKNTVATFNTAGDYTFTVTIGDGFQATTSSVDVTVERTATAVQIAAPMTTVNTGEYVALTAVTVDQFGAPLATQPAYAWAIVGGGVGFISGNGTFFSPDAGTATVYAETQSGPASSILMTVTALAPVFQTAAYADQAVVTTASDTLHARASQFGFDDSQLTYTWSQLSGPQPANWSNNAAPAASDTTVTFYVAGTYDFEVTATGPDGLSATSDVSVSVVPTIAGLSVAPDDNSSDQVTDAGTSQLVASGTDQFGDSAPVSDVAWSLDAGSVGSIDQNGLFTSDGSNGSATARATVGSLSATLPITVSGNVASLSVNATADQPSSNSAVGALHANGQSTGSDSPVTYTWSVLSQPSPRASKNADGVGPVSASPGASSEMALFGAINGTPAANNCPVTFFAPGHYVFQVMASDGTTTANSTTQIDVARAAKDPNMTTVAGVQPILIGTSLGGYVVLFNHAVDPATAENVNAYRCYRETETPNGRTVFNHLLNSNTGSHITRRLLKVGSAVYDPSSFTVSVMLATPMALSSGATILQVRGSGKDGILNALGQKIDGNNDGKPGGNFIFVAKLQTTRHWHHVYADGDVGSLQMLGPGEVTVVQTNNSESRIVFLSGTDPKISTLIGHVKKAKRGNDVKHIGTLINLGGATIRLDDTFPVDVVI